MFRRSLWSLRTVLRRMLSLDEREGDLQKNKVSCGGGGGGGGC